MKYISTATFLGFFASPAVFAQDAEMGEALFRNCLGCHAITQPNGEIVRRGGQSAPDLYGVVGREIGAADYRYGEGLTLLNDNGLVWTEALLTDFISNPNVFVATHAGSEQRSKMPFSYPTDAEDVAAYLALFGEK